MEKIEEKISLLRSEHAERFGHVETLLMKLMERIDKTDHNISSHSDAKETRKRALTLEAALSVKTKSSS